MCGLVGVAGKLEYADEGLLRRLLWLDYWRGPDSTGMASVRLNGDVHIAKIASHPADLFDTNRFQKAQSGSQSKVLLGHNRAATKGKVNAFNAHPFQFEHIVGAHNGTLTAQSHKDLCDACGENFDVDSQAVFACIAKLGLEETVKLLQGAWAITFVDMNADTLNFLRNKERPLWYSFSDDFKKVIWASEYPMITSACQMAAKPQLLHKDPQHGWKYFETETDQHYRWDLEELREATKLIKPRLKGMKGKDAPKVYSYTNDDDPFGRDNPLSWDPGYGGHTSTMGSPGSTTTSTTISHSNNHLLKRGVKPQNDVVTLLGHKSDPFAGMITEDKFDEIAKFGCSFCQADVNWGDVGLTLFEYTDAILCKDCSRGADNANRIMVPNVRLYM